MKVGIGVSSSRDGFAAGKKVTSDAIEDGNIAQASYAIAFCNTDVQADTFLRGAREVLGSEVPIIGGSGIGVITNTFLSYTDKPAGIVIIEDDELHVQTAFAEGINNDEITVGRMLAQQLEVNEDDSMLLFFDSIKQPGDTDSPPMMNSSILLLKGIEETFNHFVPIFGGGTIGNYTFSETFQFFGDTAHSQSCVALVLRDQRLAIDYSIMHGCSPKDGIYHTITSLDGHVIYELDGRPVVEVINGIYGNEDWQGQVPLKRLTLGINGKEKFWQKYKEGDFLNRLILSVLPDKSGIVIFEPDFEEGTEVLFMVRDSQIMIQSARTNSQKLIEKVNRKGQTPIWGFYINCAGRSAFFSETLTEEATEIQNIFNSYNIPLFGFYSGVEIAPFNGKNCGLDWTGVLVIFSKAT